MAEESAFREILAFFVRLGVYDVVLPFLLVFTIVFAIFEKTRVLGTEKGEDGDKISKRNLNSMVAFCIAFFVILSKELVGIINESMGNIVMLMLVIVSFLVLIGTFQKESDEPTFLEKGVWRTGFMIASLIGVILIFLHAIKTDDGDPWLFYLWDLITGNYDREWMASIIFLVIIVAFMYFITRAPRTGGSKKDKKDK